MTTRISEAEVAYNALVARLLDRHREDIDAWGPLVNAVATALDFTPICLDCGKSVRMVQSAGGHGSSSVVPVHIDYRVSANTHRARLDSVGQS